MCYDEMLRIEGYMDELVQAQQVYEDEQGYEFCSLRCQFCPSYQMAGGICRETWKSADQEDMDCIINKYRNM